MHVLPTYKLLNLFPEQTTLNSTLVPIRHYVLCTVSPELYFNSENFNETDLFSVAELSILTRSPLEIYGEPELKSRPSRLHPCRIQRVGWSPADLSATLGHSPEDLGWADSR